MQGKRTLVLAASVIVVSILLVFMVINFKDQNKELNALNTDYNKLYEEHQQLKSEYQEVTSSQEDSFIQRYFGMKYPVTSGIRRYIGKEPLRIYPNIKAPYIYENYKPVVVELINEVGTGKDTWCLVLDSRGISGYAQRTDLVKLEEQDEYMARDYGTGLETLGGFKVGDRIETLIGLMDRDYYLIYENGRIYQFPDNNSEEVSDPIYRPFSGINTLDAFVGYGNRVTHLRTNSPEFPLKDGYKEP